MKFLKKIFITGFAAITPLVITVSVTVWLFKFADNILGKLLNKFLIAHFGAPIPGLGLLLFLLIIFVTGLFVTITSRKLFKWFDHFIKSFPLVYKIYGPVKDIVNFIFYPPKQNFNKVALFEYPRKGVYTIGFVTNTSAQCFENATGKKMFNVFIPSTPSPLTGYTVLVPHEDVTFIDISMEEATKLVVSAGLLNPNTIFEHDA